MRVENGRNDHADGFTGARRRAAKRGEGFLQHQQPSFVFADDHAETVKQSHFFDVFIFGDAGRTVNVGLETVRIGYRTDDQTQVITNTKGEATIQPGTSTYNDLYNRGSSDGDKLAKQLAAVSVIDRSNDLMGQYQNVSKAFGGRF